MELPRILSDVKKEIQVERKTNMETNENPSCLQFTLLKVIYLYFNIFKHERNDFKWILSQRKHKYVLIFL